jgi:hypothetical protein
VADTAPAPAAVLLWRGAPRLLGRHEDKEVDMT